MKTTDVKQGTQIIYSINGQEYPGIALGSVSVGYNHARVAAGHHLNLIYLNEQGSPIKIFGAPLLSEVTTDDHLDEQLELESKVLGSYEAAQAAIDARVVRIGWKPFNIDICAKCAAGATMAEGLEGEVKDLTGQLNDAKGTIDDVQAKLLACAQENEALKNSIEQLRADLAVATEKSKPTDETQS